jgi:serine/threonine protein kinase
MEVASMPLQPGEIIDGKYRIVRLVGEGGMGAVYEGENTRIKRKVAIKVLHAAVAEKVDVVARFEREAQAAGRIGSEHIVEVLDLGSLPSTERFMVMEFLEGEDLTGRIKRRKRLSPHECIPLLHQVLEGLAAAHEAKIVHRDLKPDNIFILNNRSGRSDFVKILDFGVSKFSALDNEMSMTRTGAVMGTPYYMSPEQAKGGQVDQRSDIYAIGVVLYQMITGRVPFNASSFNELLFKIALESPEPIEHIVNDCPPSFVALVNRAMAREPEGRFQNCREFQQALVQWHAQAGGHAISGTPRTEPIPAMPDMRAKMGSSPQYPAPPSPVQAAPVHAPHLGGSSPQFARSNPGEHPGAATQALGGNYAAGIPTNTPIPGMHTPAGPLGAPMLGMSQAAMAVTPPPPRQAKKSNTGMVVALLAVVSGIVVAGGIGIYVFTRPSSAQAGDPTHETAAQPKPATGGVEPASDKGTTEEPKPTTEEPKPTEDPTEEPKTEPKPQPQGQPYVRPPTPGPGPTPQPATQPPAVPQPPSQPKGRKVEKKL